jgi:hypothetical protein
MSITHAELEEVVADAVKALSEDLDVKIFYDKELYLVGANGILSSLDFVNLIIYIEDGLFDRFSIQLTIVNEKAFSKKHNPFESIALLESYVAELLELTPITL